MTTTIEKVASWAAGLRLDDIPERVREKARWQQASVLAAGFAGLNDAGAQKVLASTRKHGGEGATPVFAGGFNTARPSAVFANASLSCTFDYDEILLLGHPGHSAVNVPLALGQEQGVTFGDVVTAQVAANEIAARLGLATVLGPQNGQMLPYLHCASAAIATGRLLGLDEKRLAHALAVALAQPPAALWPAFLGSIESKVIIAAHGSVMGLTAAQLASEGFVGTLDLLDHPRGFFHRFAFAPLRRALTGLGTAWLSDTLQVKLHAACWYYQALLDGIAEAVGHEMERRGRALTADDVESITCRVTFLAASVDAAERALPRSTLTPNELNFSIPACVAWMILRGRLLPDDMKPPELAAREADVRRLAGKVKVLHDVGLSGRVLGALDRTLALRTLMGDVPFVKLAGAVRALRHEFPHIAGTSLDELRALGRALPEVAQQWWSHRDVATELGDCRSLVLPIPGAFDIRLTDGRRLQGERDVEDGALSLPEAPVRVAGKLMRALSSKYDEETSRRAVDGIAHAQADTPIRDVVGFCAAGTSPGRLA